MKKIIKSRKRKALVVLIVTFIAAGVLSIIFSTELRQVLSVFKTSSSPVVSNVQELNEALESNNTVRMELDFLDDTGIYYGSERSQDKSYAYSFVGEQFVIILQNGDIDQMRLFDTPEMVMLTKVSDVESNKVVDFFIEDLIEQFEVSEEEASEAVYPVILRLEGIRANTTPYLSLLGMILVIGIGFYIYRSGKVLKDLNKRFTAEEMDALDYEIEDALFENRTMIITKSYVIAMAYANVDKQFLKISDIAWIYKNVTTHRTNGIKTNTTYQLRVFLNGLKKPVDITLRELDVDLGLDIIATLSDTMVIGYYDDALAVWYKTLNYEDFKNSLNRGI